MTENEEKIKVLVNAEEQYSYWPEWKEIPKGWKDTGFLGTKAEAGEYVKKVM
jgi:MbtH protein